MSNWSLEYNTPIKQLLFRCGFRVDGRTSDGKTIWRFSEERSSLAVPKRGKIV